MKYKIAIKENEKRRFQRLRVPLKIQYRWLSKKGILQEIFTQDVSGGGIKIRADKPFKEGQGLNALLYFPNEPRPIKVLSKVVWCKKKIIKEKTYFDVGIKHIKIYIRDRERFVFLFCEMMINFLS